jgi:hypothetical protein
MAFAMPSSARAELDYLSPVDQIVLIVSVCFAEHSAHHLIEHGECSIGQLGFHLSSEDQQGRKPPLIIEAVEVLGTEDCCLPGNSCVARPVNTPFPVRPDADRLDRLKPLDDPGKILLNGRLWPFPQPSKGGPSLIVGNIRVKSSVEKV